jgi:hypothetical protein
VERRESVEQQHRLERAEHGGRGGHADNVASGPRRAKGPR